MISNSIQVESYVRSTLVKLSPYISMLNCYMIWLDSKTKIFIFILPFGNPLLAI